MTRMTCAWCEETKTIGWCAITNQHYCVKHRNHMHSHKEIEIWIVLSRTRVSPLPDKAGE